MRTLACLLFAALILTGCGKKGPLIYPDMLVPAAPADVTAQQSGGNVRLAFTLPTKDRSGRPHTDIAGVKILKRDSLPGLKQVCTACTSDFTLFKKWFIDVPDGTQRAGNRVVLLDGAVQAGRSYTYTFTAFAKDEIDGAVSSQITVDVVQPPLPPVLTALSHPTEISLQFDSSPLEGAFVGYSLYRTVKGESFTYMPYVSSPLAVSRYTDMGLDRGTAYLYAARTVVRLPSGALVESVLSNEVEGKLRDDE
jgi:predicted small lipoprotein YifL